MARILTADELILNTIEFLKNAQPDLALNPGSVARDLFVDQPNTQLSKVYDELSRIKSSQSLQNSIGNDIDKWGSNYGEKRRGGSRSSGQAILTFAAIDADIPINPGDIVLASNGMSFTVSSGITVSVTNSNQYRATASKLRADLDYVGISDQYAVAVTVQASTTGVRGNISKYSLTSTSILGITGVTNVTAFGGGSSAESDDAFKMRILAAFSGANTGTKQGYFQAILQDPQVIDAVVVVSGDPLMTRDGTQVSISEDGTRTIIKDGTGGKADIYVQGLRLIEILDSVVYRDKSNRGDPTNSVNDFVLGQISGDAGKTVARRRVDNLKSGTLPNQPVNDIVSVSGSSSGAFTAKSVDSLGRVSGNYELLKDTGSYAGSPFGSDKLHWIDDRVRGLKEDETKGKFNGQDPVQYSDVLEIGAASQNISIISENSLVNPSDRSSIQLSHSPVSGVTRVFNYTTGERYVVSSQNPDGTGSVNTTGRIKISGSSLPSVSDILQVDYTWVFGYDKFIDYDNRSVTSKNIRSATDSIDWGYSNNVRREEQLVQTSGSLLVVNVTHPISSVVSVNSFTQQTVLVTLVSGRKAVIVSSVVSNVVSVQRVSDMAELYATTASNGSISAYTIYLPTDTIAEVGDSVSVTYNAIDLFTVLGVTGSFNSNQITLPFGSTTAGTLVECNYIANISTLLSSTAIGNLPAIRSGNAFTTTLGTSGTQPTTHVFSGSSIVKNLRKAPSRLKLTISGTISPGVLTVSGTTMQRVDDAVFAVSESGLTHDLSSAVRKALGLQSSEAIPSNVYVSKICKVEKVDTNDSFDVLSVINEFDISNYSLNNNDFVIDESIRNSLLSSTKFSLAGTADNLSNALSIGEKIRVTFHICKTSASENVSFSQSGSQYTQSSFAIVNSVVVSSGFTSGNSRVATLTISNLNQPASGNRYTTSYDYTAPKQNERITVRYNENAVIIDGTFSIENVTPISGDVLVKAASAISVDATVYIVVGSGYENSTDIVKQNVKDAITNFLNSKTLGGVIDESDVNNACYTVAGVDRVRILHFNKEFSPGRVLSIEAQSNEYLQAGTIVVQTESR